MLITVGKKTIGKSADKAGAGAQPSRVQTLAVSVTNKSVRALPAGVIQWTAVVRKSDGEMLKYSGKGEVPPLLSFKSAEISCGSFDVDGRRSQTGIEHDRIDYDIAILHNGKETYRSVSVSNFDALAERATTTTDDERHFGKMGGKPDGRPRRMPMDEKPAEPAIIGAEKMPPQKPAQPVAEIAKPAAEAPPVPQQKFDFFNLGGKKAPGAK